MFTHTANVDPLCPELCHYQVIILRCDVPSQHETLGQYCFNVGSPSSTHNIGSMSHVGWVLPSLNILFKIYHANGI